MGQARSMYVEEERVLRVLGAETRGNESIWKNKAWIGG